MLLGSVYDRFATNTYPQATVLHFDTPADLQLAALTGALLIGFEVVLTHWFYLYIPWFFPFAAFTALASSPARARATVPELARDRQPRELVATG